MRLLFRQRMLSWFDSYDIYNETGDTVYTVKGRMSWGHRLEIYDRLDRPAVPDDRAVHRRGKVQLQLKRRRGL